MPAQTFSSGAGVLSASALRLIRMTCCDIQYEHLRLILFSKIITKPTNLTEQLYGNPDMDFSLLSEKARGNRGEEKTSRDDIKASHPWQRKSFPEIENNPDDVTVINTELSERKEMIYSFFFANHSRTSQSETSVSSGMQKRVDFV